MSKLVKYLLFATNFLIFILGLAVFGLGIWVVVDEPSFLDLFSKAQDQLDSTEDFNVEIYTSAAYILLVVSALVVLISFFGCCGAWKENKCMLGTYFTLILALFIVMVVGAVLGYSGDLEKAVKDPLKSALSKYSDVATEESDPALYGYKMAWNTVQEELKCCGVDDVTDWAVITEWDALDANKPEGCCMVKPDGTTMTPDGKLACRKASQNPVDSEYYFRGCYTMIRDKIEDNQNTVVGVAIGVVVVMFLNMMFSFAMCTMVK